MSYSTLQQTFARNGFLSSPITRAEYNKAKAQGLSDDTCYNIGADVCCGIPFDRALAANKEASQ